MAIYGVDLGTTFCSVAYFEQGHARMVPLEGGGATLASLVLLREQPTLSATVGLQAPRQYRELIGDVVAPPEGIALVRGSKNHMGVASRVLAGPPWRIHNRELYSTDIAAVILRALAERVRTSAGVPPLDAIVLTHPQRFRNREKLATAQAARLANLPVAAMLTEPDAAAWAYGLRAAQNNTPSPSTTFMVFDFGGGTLDVTLMHRESPQSGREQLRALDSYGVQLGGITMDSRIRDALVAQYAEKTHDNQFTLATVNEATSERLLELAEWFKIALNTDASNDPSPLARIRSKRFVPVFDAENEGEEISLTLSLGELSSVIAGELDRAVACADEALRRANLTWDSLDEVLLTGGSSLLWALQQRMRERCRRVRIFDDPAHPLNPLTIVAAGAAVYGSAIQQGIESCAVEMRGVVPDTFSVRAFVPDSSHVNGKRPVLHPILPAGTPTPFQGHSVFVMRGGGKILPIEIFEGRTEREATRVGVYQLAFDRELPDGTRIDVCLNVASNGALTLTVTDPATHQTREARLDEAPGLYGEEEISQRAHWLQTLRVISNA
jgi:molecular chaperone DnaK